MATDVIYEEAVPVGLMTSSSAACGPASGFIYAESGPVVILGGGPTGGMPAVVQPPKWTYCPTGDVAMAMKSNAETDVSGRWQASATCSNDGSMTSNSQHR